MTPQVCLRSRLAATALSYTHALLQCSMCSRSMASALPSIHRDIHATGICSLSTVYLHRLGLYIDTDPISLLRLDAIFVFVQAE